jgi:elongation factor G
MGQASPAIVFLTDYGLADPFVGQVSMLKVLSGTVRTGDKLRNATTGTDERIHGLFRLRGAEHLTAGTLAAGEVGAVAKLTGSPSGSLLWSRPSGAARPVAGQAMAAP